MFLQVIVAEAGRLPARRGRLMEGLFKTAFKYGFLAGKNPNGKRELLLAGGRRYTWCS